MNEKRKSQRKQTDQFFGVYHKENDEFIGKLIDLSATGMMIEAVQPVDVSSIYEFRIDPPIELEGKRNLAFDAECVWCRESTRSNGNYDIGFQITEIETKELETIQGLLNYALFHYPEEKPRMTVTKRPT